MSSYVFQIINKLDGTRSEPFESTREELAKVLRACLDEEQAQQIHDNGMILVIGEIVDGNLVVGQQPLLYVSSYLGVTPEAVQ
jgi:hypothetical protein